MSGALLRRPIGVLFVFGCVVSLLAAGRLTPRLIADGMVSFAFIPVIDLIALAVVASAAARRAGLPFADAADRFFAGYYLWIFWLAAVGAVGAMVPSRELGPWIRMLIPGSLVPLLLSIGIDFRFFRRALGLPAGSAWRRLAAHRAIAWTGIIVYFLGIAIWHEVLPEFVARLSR